MTILETLIEARSLVAGPERWCQNALGRRADGSRTSASSIDESQTFCALGALFRQHSDAIEVQARAADLLDDAALDLYGKGILYTFEGVRAIAWVNDVLGHEEVIACYDWAIERAQKESQPS